MAKGSANQYRTLLTTITGRAAATHGYPVRTVEAAEAKLGVRLPGPLRDYYLSVGRHPINQVHNRLLKPEDLRIAQGRLVFMEENQWVVFWGVLARSTAADPVVFQTDDLDDGDWYAESPCSQFLSAMLCWQAVGGGLPHAGYSDPLDPAMARRLTKGWEAAGQIGDLSAFVRDGRVVCQIREGKSVLVHCAARTRRGFGSMVSGFGVGINES